MSTATTLPPRLRLEAPATRNEPIPPTPITANRSAGPCATLDKACRATASGWAIAAASSSHWPGTWRQITAGETTSPQARRPPGDRVSDTRSTGSCDRRGTIDSGHMRSQPPRPRGLLTLMSVTSSPAATTCPTNSCPRTTPGRQRIGPWSHPLRPFRRSPRGPPRAAPLLYPAARALARSPRTSRGPLKTAAFTLSASDLDLTLRLVSRAASSAAVPSSSWNVAVKSGVGSRPLVAMKRIVLATVPRIR